MSNLKIYYKCHDELNQTPTGADWDRSHLPVFYAKDCHIYVSQNVVDANWNYLTNKDLTATWTYIDPGVIDPDYIPSEISLLPSFCCSYACYRDSLPNTGRGVHKMGIPTDSPLTLTALGYNPVTTEAPGTTNNYRTGLHWSIFKTPSGLSILICNYTQRGDVGSQNLINATEIVKFAKMLSINNGGIPYVIMCEYRTQPYSENIVATLKHDHPELIISPQGPNFITRVTDFVPGRLDITNQCLILSSTPITIKSIPPMTPCPYVKYENSAIIVELTNINIGSVGGLTSNSEAFFNVKPNGITLAAEY